MSEIDPSRLEEMVTQWTLVHKANSDTSDHRKAAQDAILLRYTPAVYRYLRGATRDADLAWELFQEFALRFVRGDFAGADEERGRFRDYIRRALQNLITDHHRKKKPVGEMVVDPAAKQDQEVFFAHWREEFILRAFAALERHERETGQPLYTVLKLRGEQPDASSTELAAAVSQKLGREVTPEWTRNRLHFARQKFSDLVVEAVAAELPNPTEDEIADELADLRLLERCKDSLERRRQR